MAATTDPSSLLLPENEPGLTELSYRISDYTTSLQRLKTFLSLHRNLDTGLQLLDLYADESWAIALLESWAMVMDILSFYQERIANEGYLGTATEQRSMQYLSAMIGYEPRPGVAAQAYLAFTVRQTPTAPTRRSTIPAGTIVQSIPTPTQPTGRSLPTDPATQMVPIQRPQIFETSDDFEARLEWNMLKPSTQAYKQGHIIKSDLTTLRLSGTNTNLHVGDALLIVGDAATTNETAPQNPIWIFAKLINVSTNSTKVFTEVTWQENSNQAASNALIYNPQVFVLPQKAALYGYTQGGIYYSPLDKPNWTPSSIGLPAASIYALALHNKSSALLAGTDNGVYRSTNNGESWDTVKAGLLSSKLSAITCSDDGHIYAGSTTGAIFCSTDGGNNWKALLSIPPRRTTLLGLAIPGKSITSVSLPKSLVRKIAIFTVSGKSYLAVAMDNGVYRSSNGGTSWQQLHPGSINPDSGGDGGAWSFALQQQAKKPFVAMDRGIFALDLTAQPPRPWFITLFVAVGAMLLLALIVLSNLLGLATILKKLPPIFSTLDSFIVANSLIIVIILLFIFITLLLLLLWWRIQRWRRIKHQQPAGEIHALGVESNGNLLAGTSEGIYRSSDNGDHWSPLAQEPAYILFTISLHADQQEVTSELDAGKLPDVLQQAFIAHSVSLTTDARPIAIDHGKSWQLTNKSEPVTYRLECVQDNLIVYRNSSISIFKAHAPNDLFAGTDEGQVYRSQDNATNWQNYGLGLPFSSVQELLVSSNGIFAAGTNANVDSEGLWSRFQLQNQQLYLDKLYPTLLLGGWLVLAQEQQQALYKVESVTATTSRDFKKNTRVTCLGIDHTDGLAAFDRRKATIYAQSQQLSLYNDDPVEGTTILLDSYLTGLSTGHRLLMSGKRARVRISSNNTQTLELVSADGLQRVPFDQLDSYILLAPPPAMTASKLSWLLQNRDDFVGTLITDNMIVVAYEPANGDDDNVGEMVFVQAIEQRINVQNNQQQEQTLLTFQAPLQNAYDRATVVLYANVVSATNGQTVTNEVLGSTNTTRSSYLYALKQKPLTYIASNTPGSIQSTLNVQVNQVRWHQVNTLQELSSTRRSYLLRQDSQGNTLIYFGTGEREGNLPTGTEQLTATYRIGIGTTGNVAANSLTLLRSRPAGVQRVTNPLAASGGADPDTMQQIGIRAPLQTRTMQRIVSLNDYQIFTTMLDGVDKALARSAWMGRNHIIHITVAGNGGAPINTDSALYSELLAAITSATTAQTHVVALDSFEPLYFQVEATLRIDPDYIDTQETIVTAAAFALSTAFSFANQNLAQDIQAAQIIALLQNTAGVRAVTLHSLYIKDSNHTLALKSVLQALPGRFEGGKLLPAQMLLIQAQSGNSIVLHTEGTPS